MIHAINQKSKHTNFIWNGWISKWEYWFWIIVYVTSPLIIASKNKTYWNPRTTMHNFLIGISYRRKTSVIINCRCWWISKQKYCFWITVDVTSPLIDAIGHKISVKVMHESYKAAVTALENMMVCEKARWVNSELTLLKSQAKCTYVCSSCYSMLQLFSW